MSNWQQEYQDKLFSLDEALDRFIPDGTSVFCGKRLKLLAAFLSLCLSVSKKDV